LNTAQQNNIRTGFIVGLLTLAYFIFAGLAPALYIQTHYTDGSSFISLYSHLYRYPVFFGWITIPLLIYPVKYLISVPTLKLIEFKNLIFFGLILVASLFVVADFLSQNIAPFEVKAEILQNDDQLKDHFTKKAPKDDEKKAYQNKMLEMLKNISNWSIARYLHYTAIFLQVLNLLCIGFIAAALAVDRASADFKDSYKFKLALIYCSLAGLVSYLWGLMRAAFYYQKPIYFPEISNPVADIMIVAAFTIVTLVIVTVLVFWVGDKFGNLIAAVATVCGGISILTATIFQGSLVAVFGRNAGTVPYWTILLGIGGLAIFIFLAHKIRAQPTQ
jgi:hypothetical protein